MVARDPNLPDPSLAPLAKLVGRWSTEATHPALPGQVAHGQVIVEWIEGQRFLIQRSRTDHPALPGAVCIIGYMNHDRADETTHAAPPAKPNDRMEMHYYDS